MTPVRPLLAALALIALLALALPSAAFAARRAAAAPALVEGRDYALIEGGAPYAPVKGKVEVAEVFGYTCPHCAHFEPALQRWKATLPAKAVFVAVPAPFGGQWMPYARAYLAARQLGVAERSHAAVFRAVHEAGELPMNPTADELAAFYARFGVAAPRFLAAYSSPSVEAGLKRALEFIERSGVEGTPTLVVAGRYRVLGSSQDDTLRIARALAMREAAR